MLNILKAVLFGIVEGVTEWLPISSTGHMILLEEFVRMDVSAQFWDMFLVVIQFGAILAVVIMYWGNIFPFDFSRKARASHQVNQPKIWRLWGKIILACIPAAVVGIFLDDWINEHLYNSTVVAIMLILFGILFLVVETKHKGKKPVITSTDDINAKTALIIGLWQLIAAVLPGTSRSGATIIGALLLGVSRTAAAEFTFYLAVPVMLGASVLKIAKFGFHFTGMEAAILLTGMAVAFVVSILIIRFLMNYIRKHDFKVFGWYRIVLGIVVLSYFAIAG